MSTPHISGVILRFAISKTISNIFFLSRMHGVYLRQLTGAHYSAPVYVVSNQSVFWLQNARLTKWVVSGLRPVQFVWNQRRLHTIISYPPPPLYRLRNHVVLTLVALHAILSWRLSLSVHSDESCPRQLSWANYSQKYRAGPWSGRISIAPRSTSIDRQ